MVMGRFSDWMAGYETTAYGRQKEKERGKPLPAVFLSKPPPPPPPPSLNIPYGVPEPTPITTIQKMHLRNLRKFVNDYRWNGMGTFWTQYLEDGFSDVNRILESFFDTAKLGKETNGTINYILLNLYLLELSKKAKEYQVTSQANLAIRFANSVFDAIRLTQSLTQRIDSEWEHDNMIQTSVNFWRKGGPRGSFEGPRTYRG